MKTLIESLLVATAIMTIIAAIQMCYGSLTLL